MKTFVREKINMTVQKLEELAVLSKDRLNDFRFISAPYKKHSAIPAVDSTWEPLGYGDVIWGSDTHFWIYCNLKTPEATSDHQKIYLDLNLEYGPQWLLYLDGELIQGMDGFHPDAELEFGRDYQLYLYLYVGDAYQANPHGQNNFRPTLKIVDTKIEQLYYDMKVPYESLICLNELDENAVITQKYLEQAGNLLDLRLPYSPEFYGSIDTAIDFLKTEYYEKVCGKSQTEVSCVGHSHIDVAWKWTLEQTEEKVQRTFSTVMRLMDQYDEYIFTASQVPLYKYAKKYAPELYEKMKQRVKEGRFDPEGAMYVEADCNLSSGESLVRQVMFGKRFFKEEFNVDSKVLWLPDVFGYSSALPQILRKSGVDKFVTSKISWNESNLLPYDAFIWEGLDGTEIFTSFLTAQNYDPAGKEVRTTYNAQLNPSQVMGSRNRFQQKEYTNRSMLSFGFGDGGGGPTRWMLEYYRRLQYGLPGVPKTTMERVGEYLNKLEADVRSNAEALGKLPRWVGELYLEFHRGTYTSIAKIKKNNRKSEFLYQTAEQMSLLGEKLLNQPYPKEQLHNGWETILLNQFHDIIPGSSIEPVYQESDRQFAVIRQDGNAIVDGILENIAQGVDAGEGTVVYNPNGFPVSGYMTLDGKMAYVENVPAAGWQTVKEPEVTTGVRISGRTVETPFYTVIFDEKGNLASAYDKEYDREVLNGAGNQLQAFEDLPYQYDNWELSVYYKQKQWNLDDLISMEPICDGARAGFRVVRKFLNSEIAQNIWFYDHSRRIDFETVIDWKESHIVLKAAFPIHVHADKAIYETQFGYVERPTHSNTSWDAAKFEVCGHKYADISEDDYGAAILNDCKYGYNAEGSTLKLTLLKCGTFPNPNADKEVHRFTYSFMPHGGNHRQGGVVQEAYKLNRPLLVAKAEGTGTLPNAWSLVSCNKENVMVDTVKKAEDSNATVIRAYDAYKRSGKAEFTFGFDIQKAWLCDLMENKLAELPVKNGRTVTANVSAFEIVTIMVE